ncbi:MAG: DUF4340 domain-containing protein [Phycisphaerales bacterium]
MKPQSLIALVLAAAALGVGAYLVTRSGSSSSTSDTSPISPLFPELRDAAARISTILITRPTGVTTVSKKNDAWVLPDMADYPVQLSHVTGLIGGLADLRPIEKKTSSPNLYPKLGVQDVAPSTSPNSASPEAPPVEGTPTLVTLKDDADASLLSVIVGNTKWNVDGSGNSAGVYVRKAGDTQSWLARPGPSGAATQGGAIDLPPDALGWIDRTIINIPRDRIQRVTIVSPTGQTLSASRPQPGQTTFTLDPMPEGRELAAPNSADTITSALGFLSVDDIVAAGDAAFLNDADSAIGEFHTFDGLVITTRTKASGGKWYISFAASIDDAALPTPPEPKPVADTAAAPAPAPRKSADDIRKQAADLNAKVARWAFVIPEYKAKSFQTRIDDLLKPLPPTPLLDEPSEGPPPGTPSP